MFKIANFPIKCDICGHTIKWVWTVGYKERKMYLCDVCYAVDRKDKKFSKCWDHMPMNSLVQRINQIEMRERGKNRFRNGAVGW